MTTRTRLPFRLLSPEAALPVASVPGSPVEGVPVSVLEGVPPQPALPAQHGVPGPVSYTHLTLPTN